MYSRRTKKMGGGTMEGPGTRFDIGKLPADDLSRLLSKLSIKDPRVVLGPRVGEDAAVLDMGERLLVAKSDPITFATDAIGWYAVHVNANDVACIGASPRWFLATLLLPAGRADAAMVDGILEQIMQGCREVGAVLVGGHTEITHGINRPIVIGALLGEVDRDRMVATGGARPGDRVLLTQRMAIEATAIIAREKRQELIEKHALEPAFVDRCANFIYDPGISVVRAAHLAHAAAPIHAMHDPTEGGLATGLWELATAADVGLAIDEAAIPVYPETRLLCDLYGLDPWGIIASGSLVVAVEEVHAARVLGALHEAGIEATMIGHVVPREEGVQLVVRGRDSETDARPLPTFARDEIARLFG
jgi:hydrogenase expression/formation protein HypE